MKKKKRKYTQKVDEIAIVTKVTDCAYVFVRLKENLDLFLCTRFK